MVKRNNIFFKGGNDKMVLEIAHGSALHVAAGPLVCGREIQIYVPRGRDSFGTSRGLTASLPITG